MFYSVTPNTATQRSSFESIWWERFIVKHHCLLSRMWICLRAMSSNWFEINVNRLLCHSSDAARLLPDVSIVGHTGVAPSPLLGRTVLIMIMNRRVFSFGVISMILHVSTPARHVFLIVSITLVFHRFDQDRDTCTICTCKDILLVIIMKNMNNRNLCIKKKLYQSFCNDGPYRKLDAFDIWLEFIGQRDCNNKWFTFVYCIVFGAQFSKSWYISKLRQNFCQYCIQRALL